MCSPSSVCLGSHASLPLSSGLSQGLVPQLLFLPLHTVSALRDPRILLNRSGEHVFFALIPPKANITHVEETPEAFHVSRGSSRPRSPPPSLRSLGPTSGCAVQAAPSTCQALDLYTCFPLVLFLSHQELCPGPALPSSGRSFLTRLSPSAARARLCHWTGLVTGVMCSHEASCW